MDITPLPSESKPDTAVGLLAEAGVEFTVVCSGPEPSCPHWQITRAA